MAKDSGVFFVRGNNMVRIVKTKDLQKRFSEWQAASPYLLTIIGKTTTADTAEAVVQWIKQSQLVSQEKLTWQLQPWRISLFGYVNLAEILLREAFQNQRLRGQWYTLDAETLNELPLERL